MVGELIMLPLRVGVRVTRLWLRATEETVAIAAGATTRVVEAVTSRGVSGSAPASSDASRPARPGAAREPERRSAETTRFEAPTPPAPRPSSPPHAPPPGPKTQAPSPGPKTAPSDRPPEPPEPEPQHVSEEPTVVEEFAEPGAEDGAGAEVHIEPPWGGYEQMSAKQVISRFASASPAELAAVQLYEGATRRRQSVLNAVQRELRGRNGSGSPSQ